MRMKGERRMKLNIGTLFLFSAIVILAENTALPAESVDSLNPLFETVSAARFVEVREWEKARSIELPLSRTRGVFEAESEGGSTVATVVHLVTPGFAGPMGILVAFDLSGDILNVNVFRHSETQCHIVSLTDGRFQIQFRGVTVNDPLRLLVGKGATQRGDIQAMTGGTVTSRAVSEAVAEARKAFYALYLDPFRK